MTRKTGNSGRCTLWSHGLLAGLELWGDLHHSVHRLPSEFIGWFPFYIHLFFSDWRPRIPYQQLMVSLVWDDPNPRKNGIGHPRRAFHSFLGDENNFVSEVLTHFFSSRPGRPSCESSHLCCELLRKSSGAKRSTGGECSAKLPSGRVMWNGKPPTFFGEPRGHHPFLWLIFHSQVNI